MELEEVFNVHVKIEEAINLEGAESDSVVMISFSGTVTGKYFEGKVLPGGVDTQIIKNNGQSGTLSARYILEGKDYTGEACKIFVENNGTMNQGFKDILFRTSPKIITNSKALSSLNRDVLIGEGVPTESGIDIKIYRIA